MRRFAIVRNRLRVGRVVGFAWLLGAATLSTQAEVSGVQTATPLTRLEQGESIVMGLDGFDALANSVQWDLAAVASDSTKKMVNDFNLHIAQAKEQVNQIKDNEISKAARFNVLMLNSANRAAEIYRRAGIVPKPGSPLEKFYTAWLERVNKSRRAAGLDKLKNPEEMAAILMGEESLRKLSAEKRQQVLQDLAEKLKTSENQERIQRLMGATDEGVKNALIRELADSTGLAGHQFESAFGLGGGIVGRELSQRDSTAGGADGKPMVSLNPAEQEAFANYSGTSLFDQFVSDSATGSADRDSASSGRIDTFDGSDSKVALIEEYGDAINQEGEISIAGISLGGVGTPSIGGSFAPSPGRSPASFADSPVVATGSSPTHTGKKLETTVAKNLASPKVPPAPVPSGPSPSNGGEHNSGSPPVAAAKDSQPANSESKKPPVSPPPAPVVNNSPPKATPKEATFNAVGDGPVVDVSELPVGKNPTSASPTNSSSQKPLVGKPGSEAAQTAKEPKPSTENPQVVGDTSETDAKNRKILEENNRRNAEHESAEHQKQEAEKAAKKDPTNAKYPKLGTVFPKESEVPKLSYKSMADTDHKSCEEHFNKEIAPQLRSGPGDHNEAQVYARFFNRAYSSARDSGAQLIRENAKNGSKPIPLTIRRPAETVGEVVLGSFDSELQKQCTSAESKNCGPGSTVSAEDKKNEAIDRAANAISARIMFAAVAFSKDPFCLGADPSKFPNPELHDKKNWNDPKVCPNPPINLLNPTSQDKMRLSAINWWVDRQPSMEPVNGKLGAYDSSSQYFYSYQTLYSRHFDAIKNKQSADPFVEGLGRMIQKCHEWQDVFIEAENALRAAAADCGSAEAIAMKSANSDKVKIQQLKASFAKVPSKEYFGVEPNVSGKERNPAAQPQSNRLPAILFAATDGSAKGLNCETVRKRYGYYLGTIVGPNVKVETEKETKLYKRWKASIEQSESERGKATHRDLSSTKE
jgi:hypothetical protein